MSRVLDVVVGVTALVWLAPLLACAVLLVALDGGRPVFDRGPWIGADGRRVTLLRLRTTLPAGRAERGTARRSPIGHWLWTTRIADLPLLFNLVRGDFRLFGAPAAALQVVDGRELCITDGGLLGDLGAIPLGTGDPTGTAGTRAA